MTEQPICGWCGNEYTRKKHNQKYCSPECTRAAMNAATMKRYHESKERRNAKFRECAQPDCHTRLSRYNDSETCSPCEAKLKEKRKRDFREQFGL